MTDIKSRRHRRCRFPGIAAAAFAVAACAASQMAAGTVTGGDYRPTETIMVPITTCAGSPAICTVTMIPQVVPEHWILNLDDGSRKGAIEVTQAVYGQCLIGERYPLCGQDGIGDTRGRDA